MCSVLARCNLLERYVSGLFVGHVIHAAAAGRIAFFKLRLNLASWCAGRAILNDAGLVHLFALHPIVDKVIEVLSLKLLKVRSLRHSSRFLITISPGYSCFLDIFHQWSIY